MSDNQQRLSNIGLQEIIAIFEAQADEGRTEEVSIRVAGYGGKTFLDLADSRGRCVEIGPDGWKVLQVPPVNFFRPEFLQPLPAPEEGGSIDELATFLNLEQTDFKLAVTYLLAVLTPDIPCPIFLQVGEKGSAKSTNAKILKRLVDPCRGTGGPLPRSERDLAIAATRELLLFFDNISSIGQADSDMLCRIATGAGYRTRALYTDDEIVTFEVRRPVLITAVHNPVARADLVSRCLTVEPKPIRSGERRDEDDIWSEFGVKHPVLLGALLTHLSATMAVHDEVELGFDYRMADFAKLAVKGEAAAGWPKGSMARKLKDNAERADEDIAEGNVMFGAIVALMDLSHKWTGTADQLGSLLPELVPPRRHRELPTNPRLISQALKEAGPLLRSDHIQIEKSRTGKARIITITKATRVPKTGDAAEPGATVT